MMSSFKSLVSPLFLILLFFFSSSAHSVSNRQFTSYIGAQFNSIKFSDVPIDPKVDFHFLLSFAIDYTTSDSPTPTNGNFNVFWDSDNLNPAAVTAIKNKNPNVKVALSIGGNSVGNIDAQFQPLSVDSWVRNAVTSLTKIIKQFNLDGIDIDYEHFNVHFANSPDVFAQCIGQLITTLKKNGIISLASIAPFDNEDVQAHYLALWRKFGQVIDSVNFQFYAYDSSTTVAQFLKHFNDQTENYKGGKVLVSFATDGSSGGLRPETGFFSACDSLKKQGKLFGIFIWSADDSINSGIRQEKRSQLVLTA